MSTPKSYCPSCKDTFRGPPHYSKKHNSKMICGNCSKKEDIANKIKKDVK